MLSSERVAIMRRENQCHYCVCVCGIPFAPIVFKVTNDFDLYYFSVFGEAGMQIIFCCLLREAEVRLRSSSSMHLRDG